MKKLVETNNLPFAFQAEIARTVGSCSKGKTVAEYARKSGDSKRPSSRTVTYSEPGNRAWADSKVSSKISVEVKDFSFM